MSPVLSLLLLNRKLTNTAGQTIECFIPKVLIVFPMCYMLVLLKKSSSPCQRGHKAHGPGACELEATTQAGPSDRGSLKECATVGHFGQRKRKAAM